jgi:ankyrin repeat protein
MATTDAAAAADNASLVSRLRRMTPENKQRFLFDAVSRNNAADVRAALKCGASPAQRLVGDTTLANVAAQEDFADVLRALLKKGGADHRWVDHNRKSLLSYAVEMGALGTMRVLLEEAGADVDAPDRRDATPLSDGAKTGHASACALLLRHGANVHARDRSGATALHNAACASSGAADTLKVLLDAGALPNEANNSKETPLMLAAKQGAVDAVRLLLSCGADAAKPQDGKGNTALMHAIFGDHVAVATVLLPCSDLDARNCTGGAAVHIAALWGAAGCFALLLPATPDAAKLRTARTHTTNELLGLEMPYNQTAAHISADRGHHGILKKLLASGAARAAADSVGVTPLHYACMGRHLACVTLLLGAPGKSPANKMSVAEVNTRDWLGRSPLHMAACRGCRVSCAALLAAGADRSVCAIGDQTPLDMARMMQPDNAPLLALLEGRGGDALSAGGAAEQQTMPCCDACGMSAAQAAGGRLRVCSACQAAHYCTTACQRAVWPAHKKDCKRVAAAKLRESELSLRIADGSLL